MDVAYSQLRRFVVKLESRTYDCGYWKIAGLPCQHAMAAIGYARHAIEDPLPDQCMWERTGRPLIDPPIVQKKVGRPKKSRKRAQNEPNKEKRKFFVICSFCGGSNHNLRSCPLRPSIARANRAKSHNSQASTISIQPLNVSQQATTRRKQASQTTTVAKSIDSKVTTSQTARKIPSGPGQSSNTRGRKRRAQVGSGDVRTRGEQSSQGLSQSENPYQASNVTGSL
ncbi:hypothetical protein WN943_015434 [Citrus x changshan-huyou]